MNDVASAALLRESLSTSWLAGRLGTQPARIEARRRAGELLGVRPRGTWEYHYPSWQFDERCEVLPEVRQAIREARAAGLTDAQLYDLLAGRSGLVASERLADRLREGEIDRVVRAIRSASQR